MSKNKNNRYDSKLEKKANKLSRKIDDNELNKALASKEMADPVKTISENVHGKRFKLKGLDGRTKKLLKTGCVHSYFNKKGKIKLAVKPSDDGSMLYCPICGRTINADILSEDAYDKMVETSVQAHDQVGLAISMLKLGKPTYRNHSAMMNRTKKWEKINRKILVLAQKDSQISAGKNHGKNKNHGGNGNSGIAGGWC